MTLCYKFRLSSDMPVTPLVLLFHCTIPCGFPVFQPFQTPSIPQESAWNPHILGGINREFTRNPHDLGEKGYFGIMWIPHGIRGMAFWNPWNVRNPQGIGGGV
jgi:hypothetical protein